MPWQKQAVISYQGMGAMLEQAKPALQAKCVAGSLNEEDCIAAREAYNNSVEIYKLLGNSVIIALDTDDDSIYKSMTQQLMILLTVINSFIEKE